MAWTVEQLLATLAVDAASATVIAGRYVLIQRDPQPCDTGVPVGGGIKFLLVDLDGDPADPGLPEPPFDVTQNGLPVVSFATPVETWDPAWTGTVTSFVPTDPYVWWEVDAAQVGGPHWGSEELVTVEVSLHFDAGWGHFPWCHAPWGHPPPGPVFAAPSYTFTTADIIPPRLLSAVGTDSFTVRVTFDDGMAVSGTGSALDPAAWTIDRENVDPAVGASLEVVGVSAVDGDPASFNLKLNWEQTPHCPYRVTVAGTVEDDAGNPMDPAYLEATWEGWDWDRPAGRVFDYWRMLPTIDRELDVTQDLKRFANTIQEVLDLMMREADHWLDQFDPDLCSDTDIEAMLFDLGNPFVWTDLELTALQRRKLVRTLVPIYKLKGTALGIEGACRLLLGVEVRVVDYLSDMWCLGYDALGSGYPAEIVSGMAEPFDLSGGGTKHLRLKIDDGTEQDLTCVAAAFADPATATAQEIEEVLGPQLTGGEMIRVAAGSPAMIATPAGPFAMAVGMVLRIGVCGTTFEVTFEATDFVTPTIATANEVAGALARKLPGVHIAVVSGAVQIETMMRGPTASLSVSANPNDAAPSLGLVGATDTGTDGEAISVYSYTSGPSASVEITGGEVADACHFARERIAGVGAAMLGPSDSFSFYCFDIETIGVLPSETVDLIRKIGNYMKPAHTHLINIRPAPDAAMPDGWVLGYGELGVSTVLFE